ncbi:MAG: serine/threonine-protein kinase [Thermoplasmatota archaeon]
MLVLPYLLVEFAASYAVGGGRSVGWRSLRFGFASAGLAGAAILIAVPGWILQSVDISPNYGLPVATWGPARAAMVIVPFYAALGVAVYSLARAHRNAGAPRVAARLAILLAGLGIYPGYAAGLNGTIYFVSAFQYGLSGQSLLYIATFAALLCVVGLAGTQALRRSRHADVSERLRLRWVGLALLAPIVIGVVEGMVVEFFDPWLDSSGVWRLAGVVVLAYGIAAWRLFDLPQRVRAATANAAGVGIAAAGGAGALGAAVSVSGNMPSSAVFALLVGGALVVPGMRSVRKMMGARPSQEPAAEDPQYGRRIEAYRAALEASVARKTLAEDEPFLLALRERFDISDAEDRLLRHYAKSVLFIAREGQAGSRYEKLRLLGEGGGGRTWLARDRVRDRLVVLKEPLRGLERSPEAKTEILREGRLAARVQHGNVVRVEEVLMNGDTPTLVMEYAEGGSLEDALRARGPMPWPEAVSVSLDVLAGLSAIHAQGVLHRDLKPSNILLAEGGVAKIADFGIATGPVGAGTTMRDVRVEIAGTPSYMAPECAAGERPSVASDVYGAAAILHACLFGIPPSGAAPASTFTSVPPSLAHTLSRGLAPDPAARFPSARAFAEELVAVLNHERGQPRAAIRR